jgi:hypothetical protein
MLDTNDTTDPIAQATTTVTTPEPSNDSMPYDEMLPAKEIAKKEYQNQQFRALPPAEKRVAIAKDVLKWLRAGKLTPCPGSYMGPLDPNITDVVNGFTCQACAIGAVFACSVEHGEAGGTVVHYLDGQWDDAGQWVPDRQPVGFDGTAMVNRLGGLFTPAQLRLMEAAFEGRYNTRIGDLCRDLGRSEGDAAVKRAWALFEKNKSVLEPDGGQGPRYQAAARRRLVAIMKNIIANGGEFKP